MAEKPVDYVAELVKELRKHREALDHNTDELRLSRENRIQLGIGSVPQMEKLEEKVPVLPTVLIIPQSRGSSPPAPSLDPRCSSHEQCATFGYSSCEDCPIRPEPMEQEQEKKRKRGRFHLSKRVLIVAVAVLLLLTVVFNAPLIMATLGIGETTRTMNSAGIIKSTDLLITKDRAATQPLTSFNYGVLSKNSTVQKVLYVKNIGNVDIWLQFDTMNLPWYLVLDWNYDLTAIPPGDIVDITFYTKVSPIAPAGESFSFDISITSGG